MGGRTENTVWINLAQVTSERALVAVSVRVATGLCIHTGVFTQVTHRAEEYEQQCSAKGLHFIYQHFPHFCVFPVIILKFNRIFLFYKEKHPACYKSGESGTWARRVVPRKRRGAVLYGPGGVEGSGAGPGGRFQFSTQRTLLAEPSKRTPRPGRASRSSHCWSVTPTPTRLGQVTLWPFPSCTILQEYNSVPHRSPPG